MAPRSLGSGGSSSSSTRLPQQTHTWAGYGPELLRLFLRPLGLPASGFPPAPTAAARAEEGPPALLLVGQALACAGACREWREAVALAVDGLIVPPVALRHAARPTTTAFGRQERRDRALRYQKLRLAATVQALAWCLRRFGRLRALILVGWTGDANRVQDHARLEIEMDRAWLGIEDSPCNLHAGAPWVNDFLAKALGDACPNLETLRGCRGATALSCTALAYLAERCPRLRDIGNLVAKPLNSSKLCGWLHLFSGLTSLNVNFVRSFDDYRLGVVATHCRGLEDLTVSHTAVTDRGIRSLAQGALPRLVAIDVGGLSLGLEVLNLLVSGAVSARLRTLVFYGQGLSSSVLRQIASNCNSLRSLSLSDDEDTGQYRPDDLSELLRARGGQLEALHAGPIFSDSIASTIGGHCPRLRRLLVGLLGRGSTRARFSNTGLMAILDGCHRLEVLDISGCDDLSLFGRRWLSGPQTFAELLATRGRRLKRVSVHGASLRALRLLRSLMPKVDFEHDGFTDASDFQYKDVESDDESLLGTYDAPQSDDTGTVRSDSGEEGEESDRGARSDDGSPGGGGAFARAVVQKGKGKGRGKAKAKPRPAPAPKGKAKAAAARPAPAATAASGRRAAKAKARAR